MVQYIEPSANELLNKLSCENYLAGLQVEEFSNRVAYYMAELNMLHPFREGNGRVLREFIRCLALKNGYRIRWDSVEESELLEASIESAVDTKRLANCIKQTLRNSSK